MKINIGIVGYGNLGKAVEKQILTDKGLNLVAIFSRRVVVSKFGTLVEPYENYLNYIGKIDVMLLCGGSLYDLELQTPELAKHFDVINTFDTHSKIKTMQEKINKISKSNSHIAILSCGWDPGVFSMIRALMFAISKETPTTFWGKGISMGHSDAIRQVQGVFDGVQFTIPNSEALKLAKSGKSFENIPCHFRECFVVAEKELETKIEYGIKNIKNYFKNQPTKVHFVNYETLLKLKNKLSHKGEIFCYKRFQNQSKYNMDFKVSMDSNPDFTASIMISFINAVINLKNNKKMGAFLPHEIPISYLFCGKNFDFLI